MQERKKERDRLVILRRAHFICSVRTFGAFVTNTRDDEIYDDRSCKRMKNKSLIFLHKGNQNIILTFNIFAKFNLKMHQILTFVNVFSVLEIINYFSIRLEITKEVCEMRRKRSSLQMVISSQFVVFRWCNKQNLYCIISAEPNYPKFCVWVQAS